MTLSPLKSLRAGLRRLREHPQLWLTIFVACAIFVSFAYTANRFISIARNAQEKLVNVRVGALQDAFVPLAETFFEDKNAIRAFMIPIASRNPTIVEFLLVEPTFDTWRITTSLDEKQIGNEFTGQDFLLSLARADPSRSFTVEEVNRSERFFRTARAVSDTHGGVAGIILTRQTLSEADQSIAASIRSSLYVLAGILLILLFLFFHHARIIDYTALYRRLQEVDQLKDDFVSMASHELRTPLTIIRGYIEQLKDTLGKDSAHEVILNRIDQSAVTLTALVADMLDVARLEQGRMSFDMKAVDSAYVREICESMRKAAEAKKLILTCDVGTGVQIHADPDRLRQVIVNLVSNAIKYTDSGEVTVRGAVLGGFFTLRFSDSGIGMSADEQSKLFSKFYRAAGERVRQETGTGLGLWITKQIIEALHGHISVESIQGVGSHFIVTLPLFANVKK